MMLGNADRDSSFDILVVYEILRELESGLTIAGSAISRIRTFAVVGLDNSSLDTHSLLA